MRLGETRSFVAEALLMTQRHPPEQKPLTKQIYAMTFFAFVAAGHCFEMFSAMIDAKELIFCGLSTNQTAVKCAF